MVQYSGNEQYEHGSKTCTGILLANLGTPDEPTSSALRRYLREFLSDQRIIELPRIFWYPVLYLFILTFRPRKSAALYRKIWKENGSPLFTHTMELARKLESRLKESGANVELEVGMRYGNPSIETALNKLRDKGATRLLVLPMFPQYSATTTGSIFDALSSVLTKWRWIPDLRFVSTYHDNEGYISAVANSITEYWSRNRKGEKLLFSFHGIPKRYFLGGDPYQCFCQKTARLISEKLGLAKDDYIVTFQSKFGPGEWLQPYTIETVAKLPKQGVTRLDVVCPGFLADCLETLEEIEGLNCEAFLHAGGKQFNYIPALNSREDTVSALSTLALDLMPSERNS